MFNRINNPKIRPDHLEQKAFIYIRQSTLVQVRDNTGSKAWSMRSIENGPLPVTPIFNCHENQAAKI